MAEDEKPPTEPYQRVKPGGIRGGGPEPEETESSSVPLPEGFKGKQTTTAQKRSNQK